MIRMFPGLLLLAAGMFTLMLGLFGSPILFNTGLLERRMSRVEAIRFARRLISVISLCLMTVGAIILLHYAR
jgi:hypothetical protein